MSAILLAITLAWTCVFPLPLPPNRAPVTGEDAVVVTSFTTFLEIPVTANDSDPEGQPLHVAGLANTVRGQAVLLDGETLGVFPKFPVVIDAFDMSPVLIGSGDYVISDGSRASVGHWSVYYQPLPVFL